MPSRSSVPISRAPERPCGVSETCRKAVRRRSASAGRWSERRISPGSSDVRPAPVTRSVDRHVPIAVPPPDQAGRVERRGQRRHGPGGQRQADVAADRGAVPDLEGAEQGPAAERDQSPRPASPAGRAETLQFGDPAGGRKRQAVLVRDESGPTEPAQVEEAASDRAAARRRARCRRRARRRPAERRRSCPGRDARRPRRCCSDPTRPLSVRLPPSGRGCCSEAGPLSSASDGARTARRFCATPDLNFAATARHEGEGKCLRIAR